MMWKIVIIRFAQLISLRKNEYNKKPKPNIYLYRPMFREKVYYFSLLTLHVLTLNKQNLKVTKLIYDLSCDRLK